MNSVNVKDTLAIMEHDCDLSAEDGITDEVEILNLRPKEESDEEFYPEEDTNTGSDEDLREIRPPRLAYLLQSRRCLICFYLTLVFIILASVVALVVIGVLVVVPYRKASGFQRSICLVVHTAVASKEESCSCGKACHAAYPCVRIHVVYRDMNSNTSTSVTLFENETTLKQRCSFYPSCKSSHEANEYVVRQYRRKYGSLGAEFPCLFNPKDSSEVIRTRRFHKSQVAHGIVWSSVTLLASSATLGTLLKRRSCYFL